MLIVIGAGATRGASFVDAKNHSCIPPLDGDYFTQLQRIQNLKHKALVKDVMSDVVELFGNNFTVTMESVFTVLQHTIEMVKTLGGNRDFTLSDLNEKRDRLIQSVHAVLEDSLTKNKGASIDPKICQYHEKFVSKVLKKKDIIISYNYDCLIDYALKNNGNNKWCARYGYEFPLGPRGTYIDGDDYWNPDEPAEREDTIKLLKLHGSLNLDIKSQNPKKGFIKLKQRPYTRQNGNPRFSIIPPEWNKQFNVPVYKELWNKASIHLNNATTLVLVGYSMPITDSHSLALFTTSIKKSKLKSLVIVNPDRSVRKQIRSNLHRGIDKDTKVISFDYFSEFISCDRNIYDL